MDDVIYTLRLDALAPSITKFFCGKKNVNNIFLGLCWMSYMELCHGFFFSFFFFFLKQNWSTHSKSCFAVKLQKHFVDYKNLIWFPVDMKMSR